ncbi:penicillin-binding transpeptidase domain-containing protein [Flexithrix dorotheae]|uniref:penicillin-binding transpeptidase domain-containing protein n=1 Tax=Flexithrix dorotheae TaxID=70993 RepID=UPI000364073E|nr:penicillin-binding transpeptidase domain-containing protein [Flexithrix dorotheae]
MLKITLLLFVFAPLYLSGQNFQKHFDSLQITGSTAVFDYNSKKWYYSDGKDANIETLPASTFKIPNSLIALEYNAVQDENEVFKWDGKPKSHFGNVIDVWNKDTDLKTAYKNSTVWVYEEVANRVGRDKYITILDKCNYGNGILTEKGTDFWNYGDFAISPSNQIEFLIKLYENNLPFSDTIINKVKEIMISEVTESKILRGKTGWTRHAGKDIGWWVGYLESDSNVYFFATRLTKSIEDKNPHFLSARKNITNNILSQIINNQ